MMCAAKEFDMLDARVANGMGYPWVNGRACADLALAEQRLSRGGTRKARR